MTGHLNCIPTLKTPISKFNQISFQHILRSLQQPYCPSFNHLPSVNLKNPTQSSLAQPIYNLLILSQFYIASKETLTVDCSNELLNTRIFESIAVFVSSTFGALFPPIVYLCSGGSLRWFWPLLLCFCLFSQVAMYRFCTFCLIIFSMHINENQDNPGSTIQFCNDKD
uniref:Uncharacterized protein n=1 Tax=Helianthus annuus TaxID=4232 RepID=A0A251SZY3_HELAN